MTCNMVYALYKTKLFICSFHLQLAQDCSFGFHASRSKIRHEQVLNNCMFLDNIKYLYIWDIKENL